MRLLSEPASIPPAELPVALPCAAFLHVCGLMAAAPSAPCASPTAALHDCLSLLPILPVPPARRHLWDLVDRCKRGRAIVLTTHSMEEADILGDR